MSSHSYVLPDFLVYPIKCNILEDILKQYCNASEYGKIHDSNDPVVLYMQSCIMKGIYLLRL